MLHPAQRQNPGCFLSRSSHFKSAPIGCTSFVLASAKLVCPLGPAISLKQKCYHILILSHGEHKTEQIQLQIVCSLTVIIQLIHYVYTIASIPIFLVKVRVIEQHGRVIITMK